MILQRVTDAKSMEFLEAFRIYECSFPNCEKRHLHHQVAALSHKKYFFEVIKDSDTGRILGLLHTWKTRNFVFIEHFAIIEKMRGKSVGSQVLKILKDSTDLPIILEIEPPIDAISIKRKQFYERLGFEMNDFPHIHPSYKSETKPYSLKILSAPKIDAELYKIFYDFMLAEIMRYADPR